MQHIWNINGVYRIRYRNKCSFKLIYLFKVDCENELSQYINHFRPLIPDVIHLIFNAVREERGYV